MRERPLRYRIVTEWSDEDQAFIGRVPALPGCVAHGDTVAKATREVERAAELMLEIMAADRRSIPPEDASADY
jgi:predicted RNase H-like HicB family nuclease